MLARFTSVARRASQQSTSLIPALSARFSTAAEADIKLPVRLHSRAGKLASSLYVQAVKTSSLDQVETDLHQITELAKHSQQFKVFLEDPTMSKETKVEVLQGLGDKDVAPATKAFLVSLAEEGRLKLLHKIKDDFRELLFAHRGQVRGTVTSAVKLTPQEVQEIASAVTDMLYPGKTVLLEPKESISVIGGVLIEVGDKYIDLSLRSMIDKAEADLLAMDWK